MTRSVLAILQVLALRSDVGDNWFAQFETEESTKEALNFAKNLKWDGKPIGCAIKSENLLKGLTPGSPPKVCPPPLIRCCDYGQ